MRNVSLLEIDNLEYTPKRVVLNIPVEEFTQKQLFVPITITDLPDTVSVTLFPNKAKINFMTDLANFQRFYLKTSP